MSKDDKLVTVVATAKGYAGGPRAVGEEFQLPRNKDGSEPKSKWFVVKESPTPVVDDESMA